MTTIQVLTAVIAILVLVCGALAIAVVSTLRRQDETELQVKQTREYVVRAYAQMQDEIKSPAQRSSWPSR